MVRSGRVTDAVLFPVYRSVKQANMLSNRGYALGKAMKAANTKTSLQKGFTYRMVLPAWRLFGVRVEEDEGKDKVSREEIEGIFDDVLRKDQDADALTPEELREKGRTERIRAALWD